MRLLAADTLARVCGGETGPVTPGMNVEHVKTPHVQMDRVLTDYGYCASTVRDACNQQHGGWFSALWGGDKAAAACTLRELPKVCGQPRQEAGPP